MTTKAKERKRASKRPCLEVRDVTDASEDVRHVRGSRAIALRTIAPGAPMALAAPAGRTRGGNDRVSSLPFSTVLAECCECDN